MSTPTATTASVEKRGTAVLASGQRSWRASTSASTTKREASRPGRRGQDVRVVGDERERAADARVPGGDGREEQRGRERELDRAERSAADEAWQDEHRHREGGSDPGADERVLAEARARHGADDLPVEGLAEAEAARRRTLEDELEQDERDERIPARQATIQESRRRSAGAAPVSTRASASVPPAASSKRM